MRRWIRKPSDIFQQVFSRWKQTRGIAESKSGLRKFGFYNINHNRKDSCVMKNHSKDVHSHPFSFCSLLYAVLCLRNQRSSCATL